MIEFPPKSADRTRLVFHPAGYDRSGFLQNASSDNKQHLRFFEGFAVFRQSSAHPATNASLQTPVYVCINVVVENFDTSPFVSFVTRYSTARKRRPLFLFSAGPVTFNSEVGDGTGGAGGRFNSSSTSASFEYG